MENLRDQYIDQLKLITQQKEDLKMLEMDMNQQKLKMLIKFDKIKFLEDFFNQNQTDENKYIHLDIEIDKDELFKLSEQIYVNYAKKQLKTDQKKNWAAKGLTAMFHGLLKKRRQTSENKLRYAFYLFKTLTLRQNWQKTSNNLVSNLNLTTQREIKPNEHFIKIRKNTDL